MIRGLGVLLGLAGLMAASPALAFDPARLGRTIEAQDFNGVVLVSRGDTILYARAFGTVTPGGNDPHRLDMRWRYASVTKQIVATIAMQEVAAGRLSLDGTIGDYWPDFPNEDARGVTIEQLMRHMSGLPDPEDSTVMATGLPSFYSHRRATFATARGYCAGPLRAPVGAGFHYNNCDFIVLGAILERVTGQSMAQLVASRIDPALQFYPEGADTVPGSPVGADTVPGYYLDQGEPAIHLAAYGAAGAMNGTIFDLWRFDRALLNGELLDEEARAALWNGDPQHGYHALGQWAFETPLAGCAEPARLIERRGAIGGIQTRNFLLPVLDMAVIVFTNRAEFDFGEIWQGSGFAHDLLAEAACHWNAP